MENRADGSRKRVRTLNILNPSPSRRYIERYEGQSSVVFAWDKKQYSPGAPMGVSLRLSNASVEKFPTKPEERAWLKAFLIEEDLYIFTMNAFPFRPFKGQIVKEQVYEPD